MSDICSDVNQKTCEGCGEMFTPKRSNQKYCSKKCQSICYYKNRRGVTYEYVCNNCNRNIISKKKIFERHRFCSQECEKEYKRKIALHDLENDLNENLEKHRNEVAKNTIREIVEIKVRQIIGMSGYAESGFGKQLNYWNLSDIPHETREHVLQRDGHQCYVCTRGDKLHIHHMTKRDSGGGHHPDNLITLCSSCHRYVETLNEELAIKGCYKNALKYYSLENYESHITFKEIQSQLLEIYSLCKEDEISESLYRINMLLDKLDEEITRYY